MPYSKLDYQRRKPEETILYRAIQSQLLTSLQRIENAGQSLPQYVQNEFFSFLKCGILSYGFVRIACKNCHQERFVAFSCKRRGICPSCGVRRMVERSAHLVDHVIPHVRVRQWVLTFPYPMRFFLSKDRDILNRIFSIYRRVINSYYSFKAKYLGLSKVKTGGVVIIQRFGSALNLNPHFHGVFLDGVYFNDENGKLIFKSIPAPTDQEVEKINLKIRIRVLRFFHKRGLLDFEDQDSHNILNESALLNFLAASVRHRIASGPRAGKMVMKLRTMEPSLDLPAKHDFYKKRCSNIDGFSLHANVEVSAKKRERLEILLRYINRPSITQSRLLQDESGNIILELKRAFRDGTTHFQFSPEEFIEKLIALVPPPRGNLIRFCGILAPNSHLRKKVVPSNLSSKFDGNQEKSKCYWIPWAELLKRVHILDALECESCFGTMKIVAFINDEIVAKKILNHLNLESDPPKILPARDPPQHYFYFDE